MKFQIQAFYPEKRAWSDVEHPALADEIAGWLLLQQLEYHERKEKPSVKRKFRLVKILERTSALKF